MEWCHQHEPSWFNIGHLISKPTPSARTKTNASEVRGRSSAFQICGLNKACRILKLTRYPPSKKDIHGQGIRRQRYSEDVGWRLHETKGVVLWDRLRHTCVQPGPLYIGVWAARRRTEQQHNVIFNPNCDPTTVSKSRRFSKNCFF